jgi:phage terminase large subunit-like protein
MIFEKSVLASILSGGTPLLRDWRTLPISMLTRGERNCRFIETYCRIPEGEKVGQPVVLADFQVAFILSIYDNPHGTDTAILSIARKNAKTGTIAFILLVHLVGPEAKQNSRIVSGAMSRDQAAEVYNLASKCVILSEKLSSIIKIVPSGKKLIGLPLSVEYQAISAEGKTAHGKSPILAILDEIGQVKGQQSDFIDAITTAQGAYENPLLIYISTQAADDADLFSVLIDDAMKNKPPKTVCHVYAADKDAEPLDQEAWYKANPALGMFRSLTDMQKQAEKAARMPSFENTFRNLNLNQRVSTVSPFVSKTVWQDNAGPVIGDGAVWYGGLDLSTRTDLTALTLVAENSKGSIDVEQYFWTPEKGLLDRQKVDRQPYDVWVKQGYLRTTPGATVDYDYVVADIAEIIGGRHIEKLAFDRWKIDFFKGACTRQGVNLPLVPFGQGYKDMSPAIDHLEAALLNKKINHGAHPVLTMCAANAVITRDPADNRKMDKHKASGRIDGMVTLTMAVGMLNSDEEQENPPSPWEDEAFSIAG